jgi:hypothetical protein
MENLYTLIAKHDPDRDNCLTMGRPRGTTFVVIDESEIKSRDIGRLQRIQALLSLDAVQQHRTGLVRFPVPFSRSVGFSIASSALNRRRNCWHFDGTWRPGAF